MRCVYSRQYIRISITYSCTSVDVPMYSTGICVYTHIYRYLDVCLCLSVGISIHVYLSIHPSVYLSVYLI